MIDLNLAFETQLKLIQKSFEELEDKKILLSKKNKLQSLPNQSFLGEMNAYEKEGPYAVVKLIGLFPENSKKELDIHQGVIALFNYHEGKLCALFDASSITRLRTAATTAYATSLLSKKIPHHLVVFGAGVQAYESILAISKVRELKKITLINRTHARAIALQNKLKAHNIEIHLADKLPKDASLITLATSSHTPLIHLNELPTSCHINTLGACTSRLCEVSSDIMNSAQIFVDDIETAKFEAGNLIQNHLTPKLYPLGSPIKKSITLFNSTGLASQDLVFAKYLYEKTQL